MKEQSRSSDTLTCLPASCTAEEFTALFMAHVLEIVAYCGRDVTPALNHLASEDLIPYKKLSNPELYTTLKFGNFPVPCHQTKGADGETLYQVNPRELIESLISAIEFLRDAFGFDPGGVMGWRPLLELSYTENFTFDVLLNPPILGGQLYYCPALRWDREAITPEQYQALLDIIRGEGKS